MDVPPSVEAELRALRASVQQLREQAAAERSEAQAQSPRPAARRLEGGATAAVHEEVAALQEASESYGRRIEHEKRRIEDLDMQLAEANAQIGEQRAHVGSANARRKGEAVARGLSVLEARLDHAMRKNNDATLANRKMRGAIDTMRLERLNYDRIAAKLRRELNEKRAEMAAISEASKKAYATRDRALVEMQSLQAQSVSEQQSFEAEWRTASNMIDADTKVKSLVGKKRAVTQPGVVVASRSNAARGVEGDEEKVLNTGNKQKVEGWQSKERGATGFGAESYADAFSRIQEATGISQLEELVGVFLSAEDQNLALYNYISELADEVAKVEEAIGEVRADVAKFRGQGAANDSQRKKVQEDLQRRLAAAEDSAAMYEGRYQTAQLTLSVLKSGVGIIFTRIGCDTPDNFALVGPGGVTEKSLMLHLGLIEQRTNQLLQMYAAAQAHQHATTNSSAQDDERLLIANAVSAVLGPGPHVPVGNGIVLVAAPSASGADSTALDDNAADSADEEEEPLDSRPFTRDELYARTLRGLARREKRAAASMALSRGRAERAEKVRSARPL